MADYLTAKNGWKSLLGAILIYEAICAEEELLSRGMDRLLDKHPIWPRVVVLTVSLHLINWLPERIDPLVLFIHRTKGLGSWGKRISSRLKAGRKSSA